MVYPYIRQSWLAATAPLFFRSGHRFAGIGAIRLSIQGALPATLTLSALCALLYSSSIFSFEIKEKSRTARSDTGFRIWCLLTDSNS